MYAKSISSGEKTATGSIVVGPCRLSGLQVVAEGADAKVVIDDSTDGNGTVKCEMTIVNANKYGGRNWTAPVEFTVGIYVTLSGANASFFIETVSP